MTQVSGKQILEKNPTGILLLKMRCRAQSILLFSSKHAKHLKSQYFFSWIQTNYPGLFQEIRNVQGKRRRLERWRLRDEIMIWVLLMKWELLAYVESAFLSLTMWDYTEQEFHPHYSLISFCVKKFNLLIRSYTHYVSCIGLEYFRKAWLGLF